MLLMQLGELCVCELTHAIAANQPHVSRHLAQLKAFKLITDRRDGLWVYYRINPELPDWVQNILNETWMGNKSSQPFTHDREILEQMPNRPSAPKCA